MRPALPQGESPVRTDKLVRRTGPVTHYVILGSGVAGVTAAETLRRLDRSARLTVISEDPHGFYSRPGLAYYLTDEIPRKRLSLYSHKDWKALGARTVRGRVSGLDPTNHTIYIEKMAPIPYDRLLLATGSRAVPLSVPGSHTKGVVTLDTLEDAQRILHYSHHTRTAVVMGGGVIALELAEGLAARGLRVHYLMRRGRYWPAVLDEVESGIIEERLAAKGIRIHPCTEIAEIISRHGRVAAVMTRQGEPIPCGMVGVGIGVAPRTELARQAGLRTDRGILVDEFLQASAEDIFAAGDAAQAPDPSTGQTAVDTLWRPARVQGWTAALNMAGKKQAHVRSAAVNVVRLAGVMVSIIGAVGKPQEEDTPGVARGSSETWLQLPNTLPMVTGKGLNHLRVMVGERTLLGAVVLGDQKLSRPLQDLITRGVDITPIREQLLRGDAALGHVLMDFWISQDKGRN